MISGSMVNQLLMLLLYSNKLYTLGASHSIYYDLWKYGEPASDALVMLAESGKTKKLEIDMKRSSKHIRLRNKKTSVDLND